MKLFMFVIYSMYYSGLSSLFHMLNLFDALKSQEKIATKTRVLTEVCRLYSFKLKAYRKNTKVQFYF